MKKNLNFIRQPLNTRFGGLSFEKISHYFFFIAALTLSLNTRKTFPAYKTVTSAGLESSPYTNVRPVWPELFIALFRKPKEGGEEAVFAAPNGHELAVPCIRSKYGF
jgi:hypothetical protein